MQLDKLFKVPFYKGELGLELEVEAKKKLPWSVGHGWLSKPEGSLRGNNLEYVSGVPVFNNEDKRRMIDALIKTIEPSQPVMSNRTSLHVHVNVQKFPMAHVYTAMCAYWLVENLLIKFCGEEYREGNHFCLRASDAEWIVKTQIDNLKGNKPFRTETLTRGMRYSALNTVAVPSFGSLEFRAMRGTTDPNLIDAWSSELHRLVYKTRKKFETPSQFMDNYFSFTKEELLGTLFSKEFAKWLMTFKHWQDLIQENDGLVCELAYAVDWDKYEWRKKPTFKKKPSRPHFTEEIVEDFGAEIHHHPPEDLLVADPVVTGNTRNFLNVEDSGTWAGQWVDVAPAEPPQDFDRDAFQQAIDAFRLQQQLNRNRG